MNSYKAKKIGVYPKPAGGETPTTGTVTSVSVNPANGFSGTVNNPTTTPAISIQTTVTGILKGNGVAVSVATAADIIASNVLDLMGNILTSTIDGIASNPVDFTPIIPPATTNTLVNNGDNTLTSTVDGVASTDSIIDTVGVSKGTNSFSVQVNGVGGGSTTVIDTNVMTLTGNLLKIAVNSVNSNTVDLSTITPPTTTNTLVNNGDNTLTSTVDSVASTDNIIDTVGVSKGTNSFNVQVNGVGGGSTTVIDTNVLSLTGNLLKETINSVDSNTVDIQIPIASPTNNNLVAMDSTGHVKDAAIQVTTSSASNDNTHLMTSAAVQTLAATKEPTITTLTIAKGGTGQTTANSALNALLPSQTSNAGKVLTTNAANSSWVALSGVSVTSFNTRTGDVLPTLGDYSVGQVTDAASTISPVFTGNPTAPTQSPGNNSTRLATTAYADTADALKANIASPTFTGTPRAPTPTSGDSSTKIATTAFVTAVAPGYSNASASGNISITSPYVLTTQDTDATTMQLPDASTTLTDAIYTIKLIGVAQNATVTVPTGQYLNNVLNGTINIVSTPNAVASFRSNANNYWVQIDTVREVYSSGGNTANSAAQRDGSGNLQANSADSATTANLIQVLTDSTDTLAYPLFANNSGPSFQIPKTNTSFNYNATTNVLTVDVAGYAKLASPTFTGTPAAPTATALTSTTQLATTAFVTTADNLKANIAGPSLTGTPTAPTATAGTNTTQISTTAYVDTALLTINNINGLKLSWASATTLGLTSGYWNVLGSSIMRTNAAITINIANVGVVNGLDAGSAANNTNYYVYAIAHGTTPALNGAILSTSSSAPTLPSGYTAYRLIGYVRYATAAFLKFYQLGNGTSRTVYYTDTASLMVVLSAGSSTAGATVSLASFIPTGCRTGNLYYTFNSTATSDVATIRENGSTVTYNFGTQVIQVGTVGLSRGWATFVSDSSQVIQYAVSNVLSNISFYVASYNFEL